MGAIEINGSPLNGHPPAPAQNHAREDETDENIFLFVPNLIGTLSYTSTLSDCQRAC